MVPKEDWEERTCIFCNRGVVEIECNFIKECAVYEFIRHLFDNILKVNSLSEIFKEIKLHKQ